MNALIFLYFFFMMYMHNAWAYQYVYPVDSIEFMGKKYLGVVHQQTADLHLWLYNPCKNTALKGLLFSYTAAGISVNPSHTCINFIDHDRLFFKDMCKRSPCMLENRYFNFNKIYWLDNQSFYFAAQQDEWYGIFCGNMHNSSYPILYGSPCHYFYPCVTSQSLFYVTLHNEIYSIKCIQLSSQALINKLNEYDEEENSLSASSFLDEKKALELYKETSADEVICCLTMISDTEGFFLKHARSMVQDQTRIFFTCYGLFKTSTWQTKKLFEFAIDSSLLLSSLQDGRLYESINRVIPVWYSDVIYFVHTDTDFCTSIFSYHRKKGIITRHTKGPFHYAPYPYKGTVYHGTRYHDNESILSYAYKDGFYSLNLPSFPAYKLT